MQNVKQKIPSNHGFTLIELAITLVVMGIIATIIFVKWPSFTTISLNAQAESLANDIRYAQNLAMTKSECYWLVKDSDHSYQIKNSSGPIILPSGRSRASFDKEVSFLGNFANLPNNLVAFGKKGIPYVDSGLERKLEEIATITLTGNGSIVSIQIHPETGWVTIYEMYKT